MTGASTTIRSGSAAVAPVLTAAAGRWRVAVPGTGSCHRGRRRQSS
jgi:hypothetical protein